MEDDDADRDRDHDSEMADYGTDSDHASADDHVDPNYDAKARPQPEHGSDSESNATVEILSSRRSCSYSKLLVNLAQSRSAASGTGTRARDSGPVFRFAGIGKRAGNREPPFPDSAAIGNRGPGGGGLGVSWSGLNPASVDGRKLTRPQSQARVYMTKTSMQAIVTGIY